MVVSKENKISSFVDMMLPALAMYCGTMGWCTLSSMRVLYFGRRRSMRGSMMIPRIA